jgi:small subunit ribosomal protein S18b
MELLVAIEKAKDYGFITFDVPFREYDYSLYYKPSPSAEKTHNNSNTKDL